MHVLTGAADLVIDDHHRTITFHGDCDTRVYEARCPELVGCRAQAETLPELIAAIRAEIIRREAL
jgi:predicted RNase H-like HicB family nuclease